MGGRWGRWIALGAIGLAIIFAIAWVAESAFGVEDRDDRMDLVYSVLLLVVLVGALGAHWRRPGLVLGQLFVWLAIGVVLVLGYSFRFEFARLGDRVMGELMPDRGMESAANEVSFRAGRSGHFLVSATVDGTPVRFMVDTGASLVVLTPADAERIGLKLEELEFSMRFGTANGVGYGAPVRLRAVTVGPITLRDVRAAVNRAPMGQSLLGQSFLERLSGYTVRDGTLTLHR